MHAFADRFLLKLCLFNRHHLPHGCALPCHIRAAETSDLSALQLRLSQGQRITAAAHRQLCQLAADRLQGSTARQYCLPLARVSDPAAAVAAYQIGKHIGQQLQEVQEQLQPADEQPQQGRQQQGLQLLLELESTSTQLLGDQLQLLVQLTPRLQLQHTELQQTRQQQQQQEQPDHQQQPATRNRTAEGGSRSSSWWGPLLQLCHAECVLWHADVSPVTSQSSWQWDAVTGMLTVQALLPLSLLVQLALGSHTSSSSSTGTCSGGLNSIRQQAMPTAASAAAIASAAGAAGSIDAYVGAARAMGVAAATAAGIDNSSSSSSICGASIAGAPAVQLHAAVVVAACCSPQAVAQMKNKQLNTSSASATAVLGAGATAAHVVDCAELLAPATALLLLPVLQVPAQQLLLQQLAGASAASPASLQQHRNNGSALLSAAAGVGLPAAVGAGAASLAAAHLDGMQTPSRPLASRHNQQQQQQQLGTLTGGPTSLQPSTAGGTNGHISSYGGADVVPPTPYSALQEDGMQQHEENEDIVIKDSQDSGGHVPDSIMRGAAPPAPAAAPASTAIAGRTKQHLQQQQQLPDSMLQAKHTRQLLLQCDSADSVGGNTSRNLLLLPTVLVQQLGFVAVAGPQAAELAAAVQLLDKQTQQQPVHLLLHLNTPRGLLHSHHAASACGSSSRCSIRLAWFSSRAVHLELGGSCSQDVDVLQKLLMMAVHSLPGVSSQGVSESRAVLLVLPLIRMLTVTVCAAAATASCCAFHKMHSDTMPSVGGNPWLRQCLPGQPA
jgi:hypothetical protein